MQILMYDELGTMRKLYQFDTEAEREAMIDALPKAVHREGENFEKRNATAFLLAFRDMLENH